MSFLFPVRLTVENLLFESGNVVVEEIRKIKDFLKEGNRNAS